jgi:hypothetical protein
MMLQFPKATKDDVQRYWKNVVEQGADKRKEKAEQKERDAEKKKERERDQGRERQQRKHQRDRENAAKDTNIIPDKQNTNKVLMNRAAAVAGAVAGVSTIEDTASVLRPATQEWRNTRNGTKGGVVKNVPSQHVFWFHPFLWALISAAVVRHGWSPGDTVKDLQRSHPQLFATPGSTLHRATLWKWTVKGEKRFTDDALKNVVNPKSENPWWEWTCRGPSQVSRRLQRDCHDAPGSCRMCCKRTHCPFPDARDHSKTQSLHS